jgi:hypothetical protein
MMPMKAFAQPANRAQRAAEIAAQLTEALAACAKQLSALHPSGPQSPFTLDIIAKLRDQMEGQEERERQLRLLADKFTILLKVASRLPLLGAGAHDGIQQTLERLSRDVDGSVIDLERIRRRRVAGRTSADRCIADVNAACRIVEASNANLGLSLDEIRKAIAARLPGD